MGLMSFWNIFYWLLLVWDVTIWSNHDHEIDYYWCEMLRYDQTMIMKSTVFHDDFCGVISMLVIYMRPIERPNQWYKCIFYTFLVSKVIIRFKFEPEFKMSAIYAMLNLHGFLFLQVTYMWHKGGSDLKPKPIVFVLFLWSYNKAYFRFILEFKIVLYHNVGIWLFLTICATHITQSSKVQMFWKLSNGLTRYWRNPIWITNSRW